VDKVSEDAEVEPSKSNKEHALFALKIMVSLPLAISQVYYRVFREAFMLIAFMVVLCIMMWGVKALFIALAPIGIYLFADKLIDDDDDWAEIIEIAGVEACCIVIVWTLIVCFWR
jgi:hypothetical protein